MFSPRRTPPPSRTAMRSLFGQFDQARVINLPERNDRRRAVEAELAAIGIGGIAAPISFFDARRPQIEPEIPGRFRPNGAQISHREVIREALATGANTLLVLEDDIFFRAPAAEKVSAITGAMQATPWDVIYFGYLEPDECRLTGGPLASWDGRVIGGHFCGMNRRFMERILAFMDGFGRPNPTGEIFSPTHRDGAFNLFVEKNPDIRRFLAVPNLAIQRSSRTDLHLNHFYDRTPVLRDALAAARALRNRLRRR